MFALFDYTNKGVKRSFFLRDEPSKCCNKTRDGVAINLDLRRFLKVNDAATVIVVNVSTLLFKRVDEAQVLRIRT